MNQSSQAAPSIYPAMEPFEQYSGAPADLLSIVISKCESFFQRSGEAKESFRKWLGDVMELSGKKVQLAFYGKTVYGDKDEPTSDIDVVFFIKDPEAFRKDRVLSDLLSFGRLRPRPLHAQQLYPDGSPIDTISGWKRFIVVNNLLILPGSPDDRFMESIELGRDLVLSAPFFNGGFGELITYAANKILEGKEAHYLEAGQEHLIANDFSVCRFDYECVPLHPAEFNKDVRNALRERFDQDELRSIAIAAMRRIKVKRELRPNLADRFARELKAKR